MEFFSNPIVIWIIIIIAAWLLIAKLVFIVLYVRRKISKPKPGAVDAPVIVTDDIADQLQKLSGKAGITMK